jgi:hypothetical protein
VDLYWLKVSCDIFWCQCSQCLDEVVEGYLVGTSCTMMLNLSSYLTHLLWIGGHQLSFPLVEISLCCSQPFALQLRLHRGASFHPLVDWRLRLWFQRTSVCQSSFLGLGHVLSSFCTCDSL